MRTYIIRAFVDFDSYSETVKAKNQADAWSLARQLGYRKSNYGERYLRSVSVTPVTNSKTLKRN